MYHGQATPNYVSCISWQHQYDDVYTSLYIQLCLKSNLWYCENETFNYFYNTIKKDAECSFSKQRKTQILESMEYDFLHKRKSEVVFLVPSNSLCRQNTLELIFTKKPVLICLYIFPFLFWTINMSSLWEWEAQKQCPLNMTKYLKQED